VTLARGLSYYTGAIFEVKANNVSMSSSISGGGRYDNLTGVFGMPGMSGVGISFGVDRIYDVMEELQLFPKESLESTQVLLISFDEATEKHALTLLSQLRKAGISAEIYPDRVKLKKQFAYADKKGIPFTLVIGSNEVEQQAYGLKNLKSGEQETLSLAEIIQRLKQ
jgi:histidyl-tRNA synthetase